MKLYELLGLKDTEFEKIVTTLAAFDNVDCAIVYGSRAKGTYKPFSDIDITLSGDNLTQDDILRIADIFEESDLPYMFDISDFSRLTNSALVDHITRRGITIFERHPL